MKPVESLLVVESRNVKNREVKQLTTTREVLFSDIGQIVLSTNYHVYLAKRRRKHNPHLLCRRSERKISSMIWSGDAFLMLVLELDFR